MTIFSPNATIEDIRRAEYYAFHNFSWPETLDTYDAALHAVGSLLSSWVRIEKAFDYFLFRNKPKNSIHGFLSVELNNTQKIKLMKSLSEHYSRSDSVGGNAISTFLNYASICCQNRNFIAHGELLDFDQSHINYKWEPGLVIIMKKSNNKVGKIDMRFASVSELRNIAEHMYKTAAYGTWVVNSLMSGPSRTMVVQSTGAVAGMSPLPAPPQKPPLYTDLRDDSEFKIDHLP